MHPAISYELATARIADLRRQAHREALAGAAAPRAIPRRFGQQLWTLLHAQVLLDGPAAAAGSPRLTERSYRQFADREQASGKEGAAGVHSGAARSKHL